MKFIVIVFIESLKTADNCFPFPFFETFKKSNVFPSCKYKTWIVLSQCKLDIVQLLFVNQVNIRLYFPPDYLIYCTKCFS